MGVGAAVDGGGHDGASGGSGGSDGLGFIEDGLCGGYGGRLDLHDHVGGDSELEHSVAGVPGVVGITEDAVDAGDEGRSGVVVVLPAVGRREGQFFDAHGNMLTSRSTCEEASIGHGWACVSFGKI